jgi:hypothetical protein
MAFDTPVAPAPRSVEEVVDRFLTGRIDPESWTHPAHLFVCRHVLATSETTERATERLRGLIGAHNARVGLQPGHGGYHETLTRYFVEAMAWTNPPTIAALLTEPRLRREAPRRHWSSPLLATEAARSGWVPPDLAPLPWAPDTFSPRPDPEEAP